MKLYHRLSLCICLVFLLPFTSIAEFPGIDTVKIEGTLDRVVELSDQQVWVFCDSTHSMDYEAVQKLDLHYFQPIKNGKYDFELKHADYYWFRFIVENTSLQEECKLMLYFDNGDIAKIYQKKEGETKVFKGGKLMSPQKRTFPDNNFISINIRKNQKSEFLFNRNTVYHVYESIRFSLYPINLYYQQKIEGFPKKLNYNISQSFFYGFLLFVIVFSLLQFILEWDKVYLYYTLYLLGICVYYCLGGVTKMYTPFSPIMEISYSLKWTVSFFIFFIYILFFIEFIYVKNGETPFVIKVLHFAAKMLLIIIFIDLLLRFSIGIVFYKNFYDELRLILLLVAIIVCLAMIKSMRKDRFAKYILAGTLLLLFFGLINIFFYIDKPDNMKGGISFTQIGILLEIMFFSIGLSLRSRSRLMDIRQNEIAINQQLNQEKLTKIQIQKDQALFQQKLVETELKALRAQINPHFISNALNSIKQLVQNKEGKKAEEYLADFSQLIRTILINSNESFIPLQKEIDYCEEYLKIESLRFDQSFCYEIRVDDTIDTTYVKIPPLILQPYIENAIWHGLLPKGGNRKLEIKVIKKDDFIHCIIEDNGIGRAAAKEKPTNNTKKESYGLSITEERIKVNNEFYEAGLSIRIIDKKDELGRATGTMVELILPY